LSSSTEPKVIYENHDSKKVRLFSIVAVAQSVYWTVLNVDQFLLPQMSIDKAALGIESSLIANFVTSPIWCVVGGVCSVAGIVFVRTYAKSYVSKITLTDSTTINVHAHTTFGAVAPSISYKISCIKVIKPSDDTISFQVPDRKSMMIIDRKGKFTSPYPKFVDGVAMEPESSLSFSEVDSPPERAVLGALGASWVPPSFRTNNRLDDIDPTSPNAYQKLRNARRKI